MFNPNDQMALPLLAIRSSLHSVGIVDPARSTEQAPNRPAAPSEHRPADPGRDQASDRLLAALTAEPPRLSPGTLRPGRADLHASGSFGVEPLLDSAGHRPPRRPTPRRPPE